MTSLMYYYYITITPFLLLSFYSPTSQVDWDDEDRRLKIQIGEVLNK